MFEKQQLKILKSTNVTATNIYVFNIISITVYKSKHIDKRDIYLSFAYYGIVSHMNLQNDLIFYDIFNNNRL